MHFAVNMVLFWKRSQEQLQNPKMGLVEVYEVIA